MKVVAGKSSPLLAKRIAEKLGCELAKTTYKVFPDGELYVGLKVWKMKPSSFRA